MHLSGCWIVDEEAARHDGAGIMAILFLGDGLMIFLDLIDLLEQGLVTRRRVNTYWLEGDRMFVTAPRHPGGVIFEQDWELTSGNILFLQIGPDWVPFHPTTPADLADRGFNSHQVYGLIYLGSQLKEPFHEAPPYLRRVRVATRRGWGPRARKYLMALIDRPKLLLTAAVLAIVLSSGLLTRLSRQAQIDACFDRGGEWNYVNRICVTP